MKIIYLSKWIVTFMLLVFLSACSEDFLVKEPRLSQSKEISLSTYKNLDLSTVASYSRLCATGWYGSDMIAYGDLKGGLAKRGSVSSGRYIDVYLWNNTPNATSGLWSQAFYAISAANNIINTIDGGFAEAGVLEEDLQQLKGENLFMRALAHFDLVRQYALPYAAGRDNLGIPVVLVTENGYPARNTVGEVYDQVVTDLIDAGNLLAAVSPRGADGAWATEYAAKALLAKVYLYMEDWPKAAATATEVINNSGTALFEADDYKPYTLGGYWGSREAGSEIIFQVDGSEGNTSHGYWEAISYMVNPAGYGDISTSNDLLSLYEAGDVRLDSMFLEPAIYPGEFWTLKYPGRLGAIREYNVPVLRLSEMYLIRAEAILEGATVSGVTALGDYNAIRANRNASLATNLTIQDVYNERRRELCFEGNELFDLARTQRSLQRVDYDGGAREDIAFVVNGTPLQNYLWALPIPQGEIDANVNMEQNPGY